MMGRRVALGQAVPYLLLHSFGSPAAEDTTPQKRSSSSIALTSDGVTLLDVNPDSNSLTLVNAVSYWKQALIASANRIPALGSDSSVYAFAAPPGGGLVTVATELRFRRAFQAVMDAKGWNEPDIVMEQVHTTIGIGP